MKRALACLIVIACVAGCSDDPTGPDAEPLVIAGAVTDADGNPVANALVVLDLAVESVDKAAMPPATVTFPSKAMTSSRRITTSVVLPPATS